VSVCTKHKILVSTANDHFQIRHSCVLTAHLKVVRRFDIEIFIRDRKKYVGATRSDLLQKERRSRTFWPVLPC
jgi:hypothetical protein